MSDKKVCISTFVYGINYQDYIPLFIYSLRKSNPDYFIKIFISGKLKYSIVRQLGHLIDRPEIEILENQFKDYNISKPIESQMMRFIIPEENFKDFEYVYFVDIDMLYINEPKPLHEQHVLHMEFLNLPFSNITRNYTINTFSIKSISKRIWQIGFKNIFKFILSKEITAKRMTGLHFIRAKPYYEIIENERRKAEKKLLNKTYKNELIINDEILLYTIIANSNFDLSKIGAQSNEINMLDFNNPLTNEFRPHHGIHLGLFRSRNQSSSTRKILDSFEYNYYVKGYLKYYDDKLFTDILTSSSRKIKKIINRLNEYYNVCNR